MGKTMVQGDFARSLGQGTQCGNGPGIGDTVSVTIWEAPPATLFGGVVEMGVAPQVSASQGTTLPDQVIDGSGALRIPFAGKVRAVGLTLSELEAHIAAALAGIAHQPQVSVRVVKNAATEVTVVGDVNSTARVPLTPACERVLDALAAAGGVRQSVDKITLQLTRGGGVYAMPLDAVIRDPGQNVPLRAGDVVTALYQPSSFIALGATGKNEEIGFEGKGISLAQALARAGGLLDSRADAAGVFVFRLEDRRVLEDQGRTDIPAMVGDRIPTVYRLDLKSPAGMFLAQQFPIRDKDTVYVSNAPVADVQKLASLFYTVVFPAVTLGTQFR
ncbi:polysaccharide biosynthesis/export family protein [Paraburkholderia sp. BR14263]|uniref:polysaccharide biosynthesis/export family protein n=1 Tax=unclassified Paraburkholderia TaxID=2615204 RepID=UPI0034CD4803